MIYMTFVYIHIHMYSSNNIRLPDFATRITHHVAPQTCMTIPVPAHRYSSTLLYERAYDTLRGIAVILRMIHTIIRLVVRDFFQLLSFCLLVYCRTGVLLYCCIGFTAVLFCFFSKRLNLHVSVRAHYGRTQQQ